MATLKTGLSSDQRLTQWKAICRPMQWHVAERQHGRHDNDHYLLFLVCVR
jgi:hypothetical protein